VRVGVDQGHPQPLHEQCPRQVDTQEGAAGGSGRSGHTQHVSSPDPWESYPWTAIDRVGQSWAGAAEKRRH
jgi:hypothetical protein